MDSTLTADLKALRELASHEYDPAKLLALTEKICELMELAERDQPASKGERKNHDVEGCVYGNGEPTQTIAKRHAPLP